MKLKNSNSVLIISLGTFLVLGIVSMNAVLEKNSAPADAEPLTTISFDALSVARDINFYTQDTSAIVIGSVTKVGEPYLEDQGFNTRQDIELTISEVLKGDENMTTVNVLVRNHEIVQIDGTEKTIIPGDEPPLFVEGEHVLVFLGMTSQGEYVSYAGPYGKYLIDENNNVSSVGDFKMSLEDLKAKIREALL